MIEVDEDDEEVVFDEARFQRNHEVTRRARARVAKGEVPVEGDTPDSVIVERLLHDMNDRRGFRQNWDRIDAKTKRDIIATWRFIVSDALAEVGK